MPRILLRSGKDPFTPVSAETTLAQDVFNSNSGNYLFQHSVWRTLSRPENAIVSNGTLSERRVPSHADVERINSEFDVFVVPLANAFRLSFADGLDRLSALIERLTIPVVVVGVGAQTQTDYDSERLNPIAESVTRFVRAVLDRSSTIGVRGEFTADYLDALGFGSELVEVIGCPSLFLHGPGHSITKPELDFGSNTRLAINLSPPAAPLGGGAFVTRQAQKYPELLYVLQNARDLNLLLWGIPPRGIAEADVPDSVQHPLYQQDRMRLFLDAWTWMDFLAERDFTYGTRFHGNVTSLMAGTPAYILAHDSRTLELARFHQIPHRVAEPVDPAWDAADLYEEADYGPFNRAMPQLFAGYTAFLERNGLTHIWQDDPIDDNGFFERVSEQSFPDAVHSLARPDISEVAARLHWLRQGYRFDGARHPAAMKYEFDVPERQYGPALERAETAAALKNNAAEIEALRKRLHGLESFVERRTLAGRMRRLKRSWRLKAPA